MYDPHTRESRGFGFVTMESGEEADAAITALNGTDLMGKNMLVEKACLPYFTILYLANLCTSRLVVDALGPPPLDGTMVPPSAASVRLKYTLNNLVLTLNLS